MGWLFGWNTRKQLADHLLESDGVKTLKHCWKGNNLWAVQEYTYKDGPKTGQTVQFIALYLCRGRKSTRDGWGYKDMDESAGPYYYNCPISYLDMVPDPGGHATEWRAKVREQHAKANQKLVEGQKIKLYNNEYVVGKPHWKSGHIVWAYDREYRLLRRQIKDVEVLS